MCQPVFELATLGPPNKPSSPQRHPGDTEKGLCFSYAVDRGIFIAILMYWSNINKHIHIQICLVTLSPSAFRLQSKNNLRKVKCVTCALSAQHFDFRLLFKQFSLFDLHLLQRVSGGLNSQLYALYGKTSDCLCCLGHTGLTAFTGGAYGEAFKTATLSDDVTIFQCDPKQLDFCFVKGSICFSWSLLMEILPKVELSSSYGLFFLTVCH